ncbi:MAG: putative secretion protein [Betaproteobacteria bacterium]|nr:putative secretion protein [Betaproteobacteria bacterium]
MPAPFSRTARALASDTSRYAVAAWLLAGVMMIGWLGWFFMGSVTVYELSKHARLEVQQSAHPVAALVPSRIVATALALGQEVKPGDVLVELDALTEKLRLREEESRLTAIPPRVESLRKEIASLEQAKTEDRQSLIAAAQTARFRAREAVAAVDFAKDNERRLKEESSFGSVAQIEALRARSETQKLTASGEALASDVKRIEMDAQTRAHQHQAAIENMKRSVVSLEGEFQTTQATIARLKQDIEKHLVRAPIAGTVGDVVPLRIGAYVAEGQKLATVVPRGGLIVVAEFNPAAVLGRLHEGQSARLRLDGFPWAQFGSIEAKVSRVATEIRENLVRVEFTLVAGSTRNIVMQHGLPGSVEVSVEETTPAVLVLRAAGQMSSKPMQQAAQSAPEPRP